MSLARRDDVETRAVFATVARGGPADHFALHMQEIDLPEKKTLGSLVGRIL
jgi:hypothetical protein